MTPVRIALFLGFTLLIQSMATAQEAPVETWKEKSLGYSLLFGLEARTPSESELAGMKADVLALTQRPDSLPEIRFHRVDLEGYSDPTGNYRYNQWLSAQRAKEVANLLAEWGVPDSIMHAIGFGEKFSMEMHAQGLSYDQMRRVDVAIHFLQAQQLLSSTSIADLYALLRLAPQKFHLRPGADTLLRCQNGTVIYLPDSAFLNLAAEGEIVLEVQELLRPNDMLKMNMSTQSGNRFLRTGGMLYLRATQNGQVLQIDKLSLPAFFVPSDQFLARAQVFEGHRSGADSLMDWRSPSSVGLNRIPMDYIATCSDALCNTDQDDCPLFFCKINRFFGFKKAPEDAFSQKLKESKLDRDVICAELARMMHYYGAEDLPALLQSLEVPLYEANGVNSHEALMEVFRTRLAEDIKARYLEGDLRYNDLQYYAFQRSEWGWANVDEFYEVPLTERVSIQLNLAVSKDRDVKLFLPNRNIMLDANRDGQQFAFSGVPRGEEAVVLALEYRNGQPAFGHQRLVLGSGTVDITLESMDLETLRSTIDSLPLRP